MPGVNLFDKTVLAKRDTLYGEIFLHTAVDIQKPGPNLRYRWIIQGDWKLILPHAPNMKGGTPELYDLSKDPNETENLAARHPDKVGALSAKLDAWWKP
jgi:arylsulfatase A-like enzyme